MLENYGFELDEKAPSSGILARHFSQHGFFFVFAVHALCDRALEEIQEVRRVFLCPGLAALLRFFLLRGVDQCPSCRKGDVQFGFDDENGGALAV